MLQVIVRVMKLYVSMPTDNEPLPESYMYQVTQYLRT